MFKNRVFLSGLGIGLIIGAILLALMNEAQGASASEPGASTSDEPVSIDELKQQAGDQGYELYSKEELDALIQQRFAAAQSKAEKTTSEQTNRKPDTPAASNPAGSKKIALYISDGMSATDVADVLYKSGIIADRSEFQKRLDELSLNSKLQRGYYEFNPEQTVDQVIEKITRPAS